MSNKQSVKRKRAWVSILCAFSLVFSFFPFAYAGEEAPAAPDDELSAASIISPSAGMALRSVSGSVGALNVQLSNSSNVFEDVSTFADEQVDWSVMALRTMRAEFEFGTGTDKTITIQVPSEYSISDYSATDDTPTIDGVTKIEIDPEYKDYFVSSSLKGIDGTTDWNNQVIEGYTGEYFESNEEPYYTHGGRLTYTFSNSATRAVIVLRLQPNFELLSHSAESEVLPSIVTTMTSSAGSLTEQFHANATDITVAGISHGSNTTFGKWEANVPLSTETGISDQFGVLFSTETHSGVGGKQSFLADSFIVEIAYPKGVYYDNRALVDFLSLGDIGQTGVINDHLSINVTGNKTTGGTVALEFTDTFFSHSAYNAIAGSYFVADSNVGDFAAGDTITFDVTTTIKAHDVTYSSPDRFYRKLLGSDGSYSIKLSARNKNCRDISADYPGFDSQTVMGGFVLNAALPYQDVNLSLDFSDLAGVRAVSLPGYNIRNVVITTSSDRTITIDTLEGTSDPYLGVPLPDWTTGLNEGEYLKTLSFTADLEQLKYGQYYNYSFSYSGMFVNGQEGDVVLTILDNDGQVATNADDNPLTVTDHSTIAWTNTGYENASTKASSTKWGAQATTFHPNDTIYFDSWIDGAKTYTDCGTIIDPIVMISLPKGVNLNTSSVQACSKSGNHGYDWFNLRQIGTPKVADIDGVEWTTYYYTSAEPLDMLALEALTSRSHTGIEVIFEAQVSSNTPEYGQLSLAEIVQWDLGQYATQVWEGAFNPDTFNRAGKGTTYSIVYAGENFGIKPLIGLNVDLGIRVKGSGTGFYTYDTTGNSIAALTKLNNAEVRISYENTASTDYFQGSAIYLPIPKIGNDFSKYFQNIELTDPVNITTNKTFEFSTSLATQVSLSGFTTYYSVDATENSTVYDPSTNAATWVPVTGNWYTYDQLTAAGKSLADVTMLKLVADDNIATGETAVATFELAIDSGARVGQLDYWRAYSKAITDSGASTGIWNYSSVLAATPGSDGLHGQVFVDSNYDGFFDTAAGETAYADGHVTAILSRDDGTMANLALAIQDDGTFRSLNDNGTVYQLRPGAYTITLEEEDDTYMFSPYSGSLPSSDSAWYNDLRAENISETTATYHFAVDESNELGCYVGIGLTDYVESISIDVPIKVKIALDTDGSWCTPTALNNKIINLSTCAMRVSSASATATAGFTLADASSFDASQDANVFTGTLAANGGSAQDLSAIDTAGTEWSMADGSATDGSNQIPLQLTGAIKNVTGHYFTAPINVFDITFTFDKVS